MSTNILKTVSVIMFIHIQYTYIHTGMYIVQLAYTTQNVGSFEVLYGVHSWTWQLVVRTVYVQTRDGNMGRYTK